MKSTLRFFGALCVSAIAFSAQAAVQTGKPAPNFEATDAISGKAFQLSDFKGKVVVLEWTNPDCPFVHKHYDSGNMQKLQHAATKDGVVWVSINSSAEGKEGYLTSTKDVTDYIAEEKAAPTDYVRDADGKIGKLYGAKTTPHMFIIDAAGTLVYQGAIDSKATADADDIKTATNYVTQTLAAIKAGKFIATASTQRYGCAVKYKEVFRELGAAATGILATLSLRRDTVSGCLMAA